MVADQTHVATPADKTRDTPPAGADTATQLSQQATKPGDNAALSSVKNSGGTSGLPEITISKDGHAAPPSLTPSEKPASEKPPTLDPKTIETTARALHEAIKKTSYLGLVNDPDVNKIGHLLGPISEADRRAVEKAYHDIYDKNGPADTLRHDLKDRLGATDFRRAESTLNSKDGVTNDAGALMTALTHAKDDKEKGSAEVRAVLGNLNSLQLAKLDADFKQQFGKSYLDALKDSTDLTKATRDSLPILEKGVDKRTADDLTAMARIGIDNGDRRVFAEAVRGDSPEAATTRQRILADKDLQARLASQFPSEASLQAGYGRRRTMPFEQAVDPVALDYLKEGRISLATIATANTGKWILDNKDNIELASKNATDAERQQFSHGRELAQSGKSPTTADETRDLNFYNKIHGAFKGGGNERETSIWEDQLIHGRETLVSQMAKTHSDGFVFGIGSGHNTNELMGKVENLSKDDWNLLRGPDGARFRKEIETSLDSYDAANKTRIMQTLEQKAQATSYEDAAKIHRTFAETVKDSKGSVFLGMGTAYEGKALVRNLMEMTADDAAKYKNDPEFKRSVDDFVKDNLAPTQQILAKTLLTEVTQTGQPPHVDGLASVLNDSIQGAPNSKIFADAEKALQDPALRQAISKPDAELSEAQRQFKRTIENAVAGTIIGPMVYSEVPVTVTDDQVAKYTKSLYETGRIPADLKADLGYSKDQVLSSVAIAPQAERDAATRYMSADEKAVVEGIRQNTDSKPDMADRIRMMAIGAGGSPEQFKEELGALSFADRQKLKDEYTKKFGKDLDEDFLSKVDKKEASAYANLLRPTDTDGRQTYYDNYHRMLASESGFSADGTRLTLERANDMYQEGLESYQKVYKTLPPEKQKALDDYFNKSLEQYKNSKEKLAEIVVDATITATALAAAPFTGGASLAAVVAMSAAAGAAFRVGAMKVIEGNDFDGSARNICKQIIIGGSTAALNFIGAEVITGVGGLANGVSQEAIAGLVVGREVLAQGGKEILEKGLPSLIARGGKQVSEIELAALVTKAAPAATVAEREAISRGIQETIAKNYDIVQSKITQEIADRTTAQTLGNLGREALANSVVAAGGNVSSEILVAPFNEHGIDWDALKNGGMQGAAIGAILPVAFKGIFRATGHASEMVANLTKRADGLFIDPKNIKEPIAFRNSTTGEVRTIEPGKGDGLKLTPEWQPEVNAIADGGYTGHRPSAQAVEQSNGFSAQHEVKAPIEDGFTYASANRQFDNMGRPTTGSDPAFVVDKKELAPVIAEAKARFMDLPPEQRAEALSKYVHEKFNPPGMKQQDINKWYLDYLESHPGEKLTLGQFLKEGKGVCTQEAVLLKVLGDELGLKPSLVRGNGLNGGDDINHAWTTFDFGDGHGPRIFDPRQEIHGVPADQVPTHKPGSDIVAGQSGDGNGAIGPKSPEQYSFNGSDGWKIEGHNSDGSVNISRPGIESVKPGDALKDFQALNMDQLSRDGGLKVGQHYKMRRADGTIDESFKLDGAESDGSLRLSSDSAVHERNVRPELLRGAGPELASPAENRKNLLVDENKKREIEAHNERHQKESRVGKGGPNGFTFQTYLYRDLKQTLAKLQETSQISKDWEIFPTKMGGPADQVGGDYILVNKKTGDFFPLDAKWKDKGEPIPDIRKNGVFEYEPKWFDQGGNLVYERGAIDAQGRINPAKMGNGVGDAERGATDFQAHIINKLKELTSTPSLLNINEAPLPRIWDAEGAPGNAEQVKAFIAYLKQKAGSTDVDGTDRALYRNYAEMLERGVGTHLKKTAAQVDAPPEMVEYFKKQADGVMLDIAVKRVLGEKPPTNPGRMSQGAARVIGENLIIEPHVGGTNYKGPNPTELLRQSRENLINADTILKNLKPKQLEKLHTAFPGLSDRQIAQKIQAQIQESGRILGSKAGNTEYYPYLTEFMERLRSRKPEDWMGPVPENGNRSGHANDNRQPAIEGKSNGDKPTSAANRAEPVLDRAAPTGAQKAEQASAQEMQSTLTDFKEFWTANGFTLGSGIKKDDVEDMLHFIQDDKLGSWSPGQQAFCQELLERYKAGDAQAIALITSILK